MKRAVWVSALAVACASSGEVREGREAAGGPDLCAATPPDQVRDGPAAVAADTSQAPRIIVHTVKPRLLNPEDVRRATQQEYPRFLRDRITGTTLLHLFVDERGCVAAKIVKESSGNERLDRAALRVASVARFSPAMNRDEKVALWIEYTISFTPR